jgi:4-hydroxybenzoyl-CoA reductase subunit beta
LREIQIDDSGIRIGACVTLDRISKQEGLPAALREAARSVAAPGHRSAATLGGNLCLDTRCVYYNQSEHWRRSNNYCLKHGGDICHVAPQGKKCRAAYCADLAPALLALEAEVQTSVRVMPLDMLFQDDGASHLALVPGEIVAAVRIPAPKGRTGYAKARGRGSIDYPLAGVAMVLHLKNGQIADLRVALTGTNSRPLVLQGTGELHGAKPGDAGSLLMKLVQKQAGPVRTTVTAADYRRQAAAILARRLLDRLSQGEQS